MVAVLFKAGLHVPVILFKEVVGKALNISPAHIVATGLKVGVIPAFTVIVKVVVAPHCPAFGVNV